MALAADTIIIYDPLNGSNNNGGGYAASLGGARITTAIAYTDITSDATDNKKITSSTRAFEANDVGNCVLFTSGTGFTPNVPMQIVSVAAGVATLDVSCGGTSLTGGTGNLGGYRATMTDAVCEQTVAGMSHQIWATGTMTTGAAIAVSAGGSSSLPIGIDGRASDGSASPTGDNRPLIACASNGFALGAYWEIGNLRFTGAGTAVCGLSTSAYAVNCKVYNSSTSASRDGFSAGGVGASLIACEVQSDYGQGITTTQSSLRVVRCYVHDCNQGAGTREGITAGNTSVILDSHIDSCTIGIQLASLTHCTVRNCTFYACGTAIPSAAAYGNIFENNIYAGTGSESGLVWTAEYKSNRSYYNNYYNLSTDRTNVAAGAGDNDTDPQFTDAANGDFRTGANVAATGIGIALGVG